MTQRIQWNIATDSFENGAWFQGQLYPERCDISPDGTKLIYFAADYRKLAAYDFAGNKATTFPETWTAISKVPWLTSLFVWPNIGTHRGGGLFQSDANVWIRQFTLQGNLAEGSAVAPDLQFDYEHPFFEPDGHHLFRLERHGWKSKAPHTTGSVPIYRWLQKQDGTRTIEAIVPDCALAEYPTVYRA